MSSYNNKFREYLKKGNLKFTPKRKLILDAVFSLHKHFDADQLYEKMQQKYKDISRATIYRTLPLLIESGLVKETLRNQDKASYEHIFGHNHHDHLLCIGCGRIIEFSDPMIEKLKGDVCKGNDFQPVEYRMGIKGYCKKCQKKVK